MSVKVDGELRKRLLDYFTVLPEMHEREIELLKAIAAGVGVVPPVPAVTVRAELANRYHLFEVDLTVAHTDWEVGLKNLLKEHGVEHATYLTILSVPAPFTYKINSKGVPAYEAEKGVEWSTIEIDEVYVSNVAAPAGTETAKIHVEYRVE